MDIFILVAIVVGVLLIRYINSEHPKEIVEADILFFEKNRVCVRWSGEISSLQKIRFFAYYYSKTLYNLGGNPIAEVLFEHMTNSLNITVPGQSHVTDNVTFSNNEGRKIESLKLISHDSVLEFEKKYSGKLIQSSDGQTSINTTTSLVGANYYMPMSTLALFRSVANSLDEVEYAALMSVLGSMQIYYLNIGTTSNMSSITAAPARALYELAQIFSQH